MTTDRKRGRETGKGSGGEERSRVTGREMMQQKQAGKFSWKARGRSFLYAFAGLRVLFGEHNAWLHTVATVAVVTAGFLFHITSGEWLAVIVCIGAVFALEAVNTAIEAIADEVSPGYSPLIKKAKDVAAAAVLIMAIASVAVAAVIFIPYL